MNRIAFILSLPLLIAFPAVSAAQTADVIRIEKGDQIPLAVLPFDGARAADAAEIVKNDLAMTSAFALGGPEEGGFTITATVSDSTLDGTLKAPGGRTVFKKSFSGDFRQICHQFSDAVFEAVTGDAGIATSRVAFISDQTGNKEVYLMDLDGHGLVRVTRDESIALSPDFSYDNQRIAFTSYKSGYADVWVIDLQAMNKTRIAYFDGVNSSPAFSPDGSRLALVLSKAGNPEIYTMPSTGGDPTRLTRSRGTEASPTWSPDGKEMIYVSDDRGAPQLFRIAATGGKPRRVKTFSSYTTEPDWSPDGKKITYSIREAGQSQIWMMDLSSGKTTNLTTGGISESPVWTRNSRHLVYARDGQLHLLDSVTGGSFTIKTGISGCTQPTSSR